MNFSNHVKNIRERLRHCLSYSKIEMLTELRNCLLDAKGLLKTSSFDFYTTQFETIDIAEFATTHYGIKQVKSTLSRRDLRSANSARNLESELRSVCPNLLTYTVDDSCNMQTEFHWYYSIDGGFIYKKSEMGIVESPDGKKVFGLSRVAKISELPIEFQSNLI